MDRWTPAGMVAWVLLVVSACSGPGVPDDGSGAGRTPSTTVSSTASSSGPVPTRGQTGTAPVHWGFVFPVLTTTTYSEAHHDYPATDVFAPCDAQVVAPFAGTVTRRAPPTDGARGRTPEQTAAASLSRWSERTASGSTALTSPGWTSSRVRASTPATRWAWSAAPARRPAPRATAARRPPGSTPESPVPGRRGRAGGGTPPGSGSTPRVRRASPTPCAWTSGSRGQAAR